MDRPIATQSLDLAGHTVTLGPHPVIAILPLRHDVIIRGTGRSSDHFDGDHDPATIHLAATCDSEVIACLSLMHRPLESRDGFQLRGMAVRPDWQGRGLGAALLSYTCNVVAASTPVRLLWCNARSSAAGFYQRHGWRIVSDPFDIPGVGMHVRMRCELAL